MLQTRWKRFTYRLSMIPVIVKTQWSLRHAKIGSRVRAFGKLHIQAWGTIEIGSGTCFHSGALETELTAFAGAHLRIGKDCQINKGTVINASLSIDIADRCQIGYGVIILDSHLHEEAVEERHLRPKPMAVIIEEDVWLGSRVMIMPGVRIGRGSIVAAGSIVTRDVPPLSLFAGSPAKLVRSVREAKSRLAAFA